METGVDRCSSSPVLTSLRPSGQGQESPEPATPVCRGSGLREASGGVQAATFRGRKAPVSRAQREGGGRTPTRAGAVARGCVRRAAWTEGHRSGACTPSLPHTCPACAPRLCPLLSTAAGGSVGPWVPPQSKHRAATAQRRLDAPQGARHSTSRHGSRSLLSSLPPPLPGRGKSACGPGKVPETSVLVGEEPLTPEGLAPWGPTGLLLTRGPQRRERSI